MLLRLLSEYFKSIFFFFKKNSIKENLKKIQNSNLGEECYVFGDGGSIKYFDLSLFNDKPSIASNNFLFHKNFNKLNIKYYTIIAPYWFFPFFITFFKGKKFYFNRIQKLQRLKFKTYSNITFFTDISNYIFLRGNNIFYTEKNYVKNLIPFKINNLDPIEGALRAQITFAIFLGFKKVFLIGHDYTHKKSMSKHFYEKGKQIPNNLTHWNKDFLEIANQYIDIVTVTLEGGSNVLESITYKKLTGKTPAYKENIEIVDKENLKALSSWPYYSL